MVEVDLAPPTCSPPKELRLHGRPDNHIRLHGQICANRVTTVEEWEQNDGEHLCISTHQYIHGSQTVWSPDYVHAMLQSMHDWLTSCNLCDRLGVGPWLGHVVVVHPMWHVWKTRKAWETRRGGGDLPLPWDDRRRRGGEHDQWGVVAVEDLIPLSSQGRGDVGSRGFLQKGSLSSSFRVYRWSKQHRPMNQCE